MRLELFGIDVHAHEQAPGGEDGGRGQADRGGMQQEFRAAMHELEDADQAFDRQRYHHHDQEARQEAAHAGRGTDVDRALHFFFQHGLAQFQRGNRDRQQAHAFQDEFETLPYLKPSTRIEGAPGFHGGENDQAQAAHEEQGDDQHVPDQEDVLDVFHDRRQVREL